MSLMTPEKMQNIIEAALMVAGQPLNVNTIQKMFAREERPEKEDITAALDNLKARYEDSGIELRQVASGYRLQARPELSQWLALLWEERPPRYSRAFMETLSIIAYKQPVTRAEIEEIRGVTVSTNIIKTLMEREWVRVLGQLDVPGKPSIYGTTKAFLDYFNLTSLKELPPLPEFKDLAAQDEQLQVQLALENSGIGPDNSENIPEERDAVIAEDVTADADEDEAAADQIAAQTDASDEVENVTRFEEEYEEELEENLATG